MALGNFLFAYEGQPLQNRVERRNARNFRSERYAANDFALIVPFGSCF
jgi:hypothetical protein